MTLNQITKILSIGQLAIDLHNANNLAKALRSEYWDKLHEYEEDHGDLVGRLTFDHPDHAGAIAATKDEYAAYKKAKRSAYNIKRRLDYACGRIANA